MRNLKTKDLGLFSKIISKMQIKTDVMNLFQSVEGLDEEELNVVNQKLGVEIGIIFLENYWKAEQEVFTLLGGLTGKTKEEIGEGSPIELMEALKGLTNDPSFTAFFQLVTQ